MAITRLGDICDIISGKKPDCNLNTYLSKEKIGLPFPKQSDINNNYLESTLLYFDEKFYDMTSITSGFNIYFLPDADAKPFVSSLKFCMSPSIWKLMPIDNILTKKYLFYLLLKNKSKIDQLKHGTTIQHISRKDFNNLKLEIPSINEQVQIINIIGPKEELFLKFYNIIDISSYESFMKSWVHIINIIEPFEKMKLSFESKIKTINKTLEAMYLFNDGKYVPITEIANLHSQKKNKQQKYIDTSNIGTSEILDYTFDVDKSRANLTPIKNSIIFTKLKNQEKIFPIFNGEESEYVFSTGFMNIEAEKYTAYVYGWLLSQDYLNQKNKLSTGTLMEGINNGIFHQLKIKTPCSFLPNVTLKYLGLLAKIKKLLNQIIINLINLYVD